jgi:hypothetical protein
VQSPPINTATYGNWSAMLDGDRMVWELAVYDADAATMAHIHQASPAAKTASTPWCSLDGVSHAGFYVLHMQGGPTDSGPVIVFLVPVGVGCAATTQDLPQLSPPVSGDRERMRGWAVCASQPDAVHGSLAQEGYHRLSRCHAMQGLGRAASQLPTLVGLQQGRACSGWWISSRWEAWPGRLARAWAAITRRRAVQQLQVWLCPCPCCCPGPPQNNRAYVNVHSVQYPAGVIRGQVVYE